MVARYREITLSGIGYFAVMLGCSRGQVNQWAAGGSWRVNSDNRSGTNGSGRHMSGNLAGRVELLASCPLFACD